MKITRWAVNVTPTLPFYSFGNVAILGDAVSSVMWRIRTTSEHDKNAGARHDTVSGSGCRTSYRGQFLFIFSLACEKDMI